ncbi:YidC/Oxa1 family membrane protein insertase [Petroclostridium sp. X23]|jgi:YidC/Oxa1 family membrane protein insertase|uniref:YidC/Oxa1 family membrane protein insertase n=1 Tax=Petroclostridium sp. X23 TaxID=3045146 RepID=UPI0024AD0A74|nr:YidC/Oxa1 family membrane protein insertase [Petroclostridium sp. X23]WHH57251.1 YidC/Oxa1 family membrane protein insertase [Petroclostridium sp. X23]
MGDIFGLLITGPLGSVLSFIYSFTNSYGFAIVLFTIFIKLILLPLAIKQQKSMAEMQKIQPLLTDIQKKYKNDKEKLQVETMKIYQEHKVNPAGSCLPLLIQLPIIFGLYRVIYQPLTYILKMSKEEIAKIAAELSINVRDEIKIAEQMKNINLEFLGLNLAQTPQFNAPSVIWIIPVLAALTTYLSSKLTSTATSGSQNAQAAQMTSSMMTIFPFMTGFICFSLPAGVGLYWVISNLIQMLQQVALNKLFAPAIKEGKA